MDDPVLVLQEKQQQQQPLNDSLLAEVQSGLYIGSLMSIRELRKRPHLSWLVVSLVSSPPMILLVHRQLQELRKQSSMKVKHVEWHLPDKSDADFVGPRLEQVLREIDAYILVNATATAAAASPANDPADTTTTTAVTATTTFLSTSTTTDTTASRTRTCCCLVHCALGISRSASVVAAWLLTRQQQGQCQRLSLHEVMDQIRRVRPSVQPNLGFLAGLRATEQCGGSIDGAILRLHHQQQSEEQKRSLSLVLLLEHEHDVDDDSSSPPPQQEEEDGGGVDPS